MKSRVGVLRQPKPGKQPSWLFPLVLVAVGGGSIGSSRCQILLRVRRRQIRKFTGQALFQEKTRNFSRLINLRQRQGWKFNTGRGLGRSNFRTDFAPAIQYFLCRFWFIAHAFYFRPNKIAVLPD